MKASCPSAPEVGQGGISITLHLVQNTSVYPCRSMSPESHAEGSKEGLECHPIPAVRPRYGAVLEAAGDPGTALCIMAVRVRVRVSVRVRVRGRE